VVPKNARFDGRFQGLSHLMALELVTIQADGRSYSTWLEATVEAGAQQAARSFSVITAEPGRLFKDEWVFRPGVEVSIYASGDLLCKGFVDDYSPEFSATEHRAVIAGRSKSKDAIDSSAIHKTGEWKKKKIDEIGKDLLKPFRIELTSDLKSKEIPVWRLAPGATVFEEIEALARQEGALIIGRPDGSMHLTRADKFELHSGALQQGVNILQASAQLSERGKHDAVYARGQKGLGSGEDAHRLEYVSRDKTVERHRPKLILAEGDMDTTRLKQRAKWQTARNAGWATTATIKVRGWRDDSGELWNPEKLIFVESDFLKISQVMAIRHVRFMQNDSEGTTATMSLVDPQALGGKDGKGKSNGAWDLEIE
jgi:prophage tail gpP-like protein